MPQIQTDKHPIKACQNVSIGELYAEGHSQLSIAKKLNLTKRIVEYRLSTSQEAQNIIEHIRIKQAQLLPTAHDKHEDLINDIDNRIALDAVKLTYQCTGIIGTHTRNQFNTQVNIGNDSIREFIGHGDQDQAYGDDVIDV